MNLTIRREPFSVFSVKGEFFIDEVFFCYSLERPEFGSNVVAIPAGTYDVVLTYSPHFDKNLPHIVGVPGRTAILMHGGNTASNSLGCTLLGYKEFDDDTIGDAQAVADFLVLMVAAVGRGERVRIAIIDP